MGKKVTSSKPKKKTPVLENAKARFRFHIIESLEVGIVLKGSEVKSLRQVKANLTEAYATIRNQEVFLINFYIEAYSKAGNFGHDERRSRKLLLKKSQILSFAGTCAQQSLVLIPLKLYFNAEGRVKLLLGLCKGKKQRDQRQDIKKRESEIEIQRYLNKQQQAGTIYKAQQKY